VFVPYPLFYKCSLGSSNLFSLCSQSALNTGFRRRGALMANHRRTSRANQSVLPAKFTWKTHIPVPHAGTPQVGSSLSEEQPERKYLWRPLPSACSN
jgi:hypothetical protein